MGKTIHALSNSNNDVTLVNNRVNILLFRDGVRDVLDSDAYVFIAVEGGDKIYYFEMGSHKLGTRC